ncbi:MAG TPA: hypothetical protein VFO18_05450 [Methylomirabilota bacterium]|nr:hypothetical protein [Methylomirabilota bacterium]
MRAAIIERQREGMAAAALVALAPADPRSDSTDTDELIVMV